MSDDWPVLIAAVSTLTAALGTTSWTARSTRRRDRDERADRERLTQREAVVDLLDEAVQWDRSGKALFTTAAAQTVRTIAENEAMESYSAAERAFGKALTTVRLMFRDRDIRTKLDELSSIHVAVFDLTLRVLVETGQRGEPGYGPAYHAGQEAMKQADVVLKDIEALTASRLAL